MRPQRSLVLGANGFLGATLCRTLIERGEAFRAFDKRPPRIEIQRTDLEWFKGDFHNSNHLSEAMIGCDSVYHLISTTIPATSNKNPITDCQENVIGTLKLLELAKQVGIKKIIFASSGGTVYGAPNTLPIPETAPTNPLCAYGIGKLMIEKYLSLYNLLHNIDYCVLRISNLYGYFQSLYGKQGAVGVFLGKALNDKTIEIWGDGNVVRDYVFADDVVAAMLMAMRYDGEYKIFNIGDGQGRSLNQVLETIERASGKRLHVKYTSDRVYDVPKSILDISRAKQCLRWQPLVTFEQGLASVAEYHLNRFKRYNSIEG